MAETAVPQRITTLATHEMPDIDDVASIDLIKSEGENLYPGVREAGIALYNTREFGDKTPDELEREGTLLIGVGLGWADEHARPDQPKEERDCAAIRVAKRLGVENDPAYRSILRYAERQNNSAKSGKFDLGPLIKYAFRGIKSEDLSQNIADIFADTFLLLNAVKRNDVSIANNTAPIGTVPYSLCEIIVAWRKSCGSDSLVRPIRGFVPSNFEESEAARLLNPEKHPHLASILELAKSGRRVDNSWTASHFDLGSLIRLAFQHQVGSEDDILNVAFRFLDALEAKESSFQYEVGPLWHNKQRTKHAFVKTSVTTDSGGTFPVEYRITSVSAPVVGPEFNRFCRSPEGGRAAVVIQWQESTGNVQIFFNQKHSFDPAMVIAEIRMAAREKRGLTAVLPLELRRSEGDHVEGAEEYYFDGHQILNGSLTTQKPPSILTLQEIENIVFQCIERQIRGVAELTYEDNLPRLQKRYEQLLKELNELKKQL